MSSRQPVQLTFSLENLSSHSTLPSGLRDGWGAAFYQGKDVALFREPSAASDSALIRFLEHQGPSTTLAISHIRHATRGAVTLSNTQPFSREMNGRVHVFAHNGDLPDIEKSSNLAYDRYTPVGTSDSEHAFCALLERLSCISSLPSFTEQLSVLVGFAADLRQLGQANFLYSDGTTLFAHGDRRLHPDSGRITAPGLYLYACHCENMNESIKTHGLSIASGFQDVALVASVPLSDQNSNWRPFEEGEILAVSEGRRANVAAVGPNASPKAMLRRNA